MFPQHVLGAGAALAGLPAALLLLLSAWDGIAGVAALSNAACYDSAGGARPGYYPCDATAFITNCCQQGWTCFSNALCVVTTETLSQPNLTLGQVQRGMCTNPQWNNQICGDRCLNGDNINGELVYCGDHKFCCKGDWNAGLCTCDPDGKAFVINDGKAQTIVGVTETTFSGVPSIATTRPTPQPTTSRTTGTGTGTTGSPTTARTGDPTANPDDSGGGGGGLSQGAKIGIGVGVSLGVVALLVGALFAWRHSRKNRRPGFVTDFDRTPAEEGTAVQQAMARDNFYPPLRVGADRDNPFRNGDSN